MKHVKLHQPDLDIRMVFQYNRIYNKATGKRYTDYCDSIGVPWCIGVVPDDWLLHTDQPFPAKGARTLYKVRKEIGVPKRKLPRSK